MSENEALPDISVALGCDTDGEAGRGSRPVEDVLYLRPGGARSPVVTLEPRLCWHEFMTDRAVTQASGWWVPLDQFLDRAERVLSCELARREDLATVGTSGKFIASLAEANPWCGPWSEVTPRSPTSSRQQHVSGPLFRQDERVQHGRVTNALGALAQGAPEPQRELVKLLKKAWKQHDTGYRWSLGSTRNGGSGEMRNDRQIAHDFLYGDLVHAADDARQRLRGVPQGARLVAATAWAADAIKLTLATKQLVVDLRDGGYLSPRPS